MIKSIGEMEIDHSSQPIRLFKSDFLEFFTHVHPAVVVAIWLPVAAYFLLSAIASAPAGAPALHIPVAFLIGVFVWTLTEYLMHRFVFHFHPTAPWAQRIFFLFHGVHHAQPQCKTRLVMPPAASVPMALIFIAGFYLLVGVVLGLPHWVAPLISGFTLGYLSYDMMHYATHHLPMNGRLLKYLKRYHMLHHFKTPEQRYGVSSPLWDIVFNTKPE
ncbi:MAG: sterol desaturase family protein [Chloroflexi bacterium]|nr:sterol desaturase family protein [Chloroflexota bacterium]